MRLFKHKCIFVLVFLWMTPVDASDHGGGGGAEAPAPVKVPRAQKEYAEKTAKLNTLANKIIEADKEFEHLVHAKEAAHTIEAKQEIIQQMVTVSTERRKANEEYLKLKSEVGLRYPNSGPGQPRNYSTEEKKHNDEANSQHADGLDEMLLQTKKMIDRKYAPLKVEEDPPEYIRSRRQPSSEDASLGRKKLRLEK